MGVNATVADDWAGHRGRRWLRDVDVMEEQLAPVGEALLQRAAPAPGERVLDVGCGAGWTTRRIAEAVGPDGLALGLDISEPLLAEAARRGEDLGAPDVLERYQGWRRFDSVSLALGMDTVNKLVSNDNPILRAGRDLGLGLVNAIPGLRRGFMRQAAGLTGELPKLLAGHRI